MTLHLPQPPTTASERILCYLHVAVPSRFRDAVNRHHAHLLDLVALLEAAHVPREEITSHLEHAVASYRTELLSAIDAHPGD